MKTALESKCAVSSIKYRTCEFSLTSQYCTIWIEERSRSLYTSSRERERGREWAHMSESDNQLPSLCQGPEISEADVENHLVILRGIAWASRGPFTNYKKCI